MFEAFWTLVCIASLPHKTSVFGHLLKCFAACGRSQREFNFTGNTTTTDGGHNNASRGDFPWMVAVYIENDEGTWEQICGGTLISSSLILSGNFT